MDTTQVGGVTLGEILQVLETCRDDLTPKTMCLKIAELHFQKCGPTTLKTLLDHIANTRGGLDVLWREGVPCEWICHLYDVVISSRLLADLKDEDEDLVTKLQGIIRTSWNKMLETM